MTCVVLGSVGREFVQIQVFGGNLLSYHVNAPKRDLPDGPLYAMRPNHLGWILFIIVPGALLPALLIRGFGIRQSHAVLEQVST